MTNDELVANVRTVADAVQTTLGPFGANKLLVQQDGTVTATASSTELLERFDITDPAMTLLQTAASGFGDRYGDGTGTVVTLAGALLREADGLAEQGLHPTAIEQGYRDGLDSALAAIDRTARPLSPYGAEAVAKTALTGTRDPQVRQSVSAQVASVVEQVGPDGNDSVRVVSRPGGATAETELLRGVVLERGPILESMPRSPGRDGIAVLSSSVDVPHVGSQLGDVSRRVVFDADSFEAREGIAEYESEAFAEQLQAAIDAGCGAIVTERAINERVQTRLAAEGILGIQRVDTDELRGVARITDATVVPSLDQVSEVTLGRGTITVQRKTGRDVTVFKSDAGEPAYTLFCRAPDPRTVTAFEHSVETAIAATAAAVRDGRVVPGGGAVEATVSQAVKSEARSLEGRQQLSADAFGTALMTIPRVLARTAGLDGGRTVVQLRVARSDGRDSTGIDALAGTTADVLGDDPIIEPVSTKKAILTAATDLATQLIRIDDRLQADDLSDDDDVVPEEEPTGGQQAPAGQGRNA
ncbi:TCP-1/cpn60 chaperonin family protein [Haloarcula brevis]|uniref:TCP-1/cpn60 chaperonin family protein n=1 Tax=Haloarcula brevis TaxID=3111453 RepID=UPI00300E892C